MSSAASASKQADWSNDSNALIDIASPAYSFRAHACTSSRIIKRTHSKQVPQVTTPLPLHSTHTLPCAAATKTCRQLLPRKKVYCYMFSRSHELEIGSNTAHQIWYNRITDFDFIYTLLAIKGSYRSNVQQSDPDQQFTDIRNFERSGARYAAASSIFAAPSSARGGISQSCMRQALRRS